MKLIEQIAHTLYTEINELFLPSKRLPFRARQERVQRAIEAALETVNQMEPERPVSPTEAEAYIAAARAQYEDEGRIEIDTNAQISIDPEADPAGAYVQAWVWVYRDQLDSSTDAA